MNRDALAEAHFLSLTNPILLLCSAATKLDLPTSSR
jgi:hypothetical protein